MALIDSRKVVTGVFTKERPEIAERTLRTDRWWLQPALTFGVLISFVIYATFRAFEKKYYFAEPLISPFTHHVYQLPVLRALLTLAHQLVQSPYLAC